MPAVVKRAPQKTVSEHVQDETTVVEALSAEDAEQLLADAPDLIPYQNLRVRRRKAFLTVGEKYGLVVKEGETPREPTLDEMFGMLADMDDALESVALDPQAYALWATGPDEELLSKLSALFSRYMDALGNSTGSAS